MYNNKQIINKYNFGNVYYKLSHGIILYYLHTEFENNVSIGSVVAQSGLELVILIV